MTKFDSKKTWATPSLKTLSVDRTLGGIVDQFAESIDSGFTSNGQPLLGNGVNVNPLS